MKRCVNCLMAETKPGTVLNKDGLCRACLHALNKKEVDWDARFAELKKLCDKHRRKDGYYDCIVTGSGGKDSMFQTYVMRDLMGMHVLLLNVATNYQPTQTGVKNMYNWSDVFNCDQLILTLSHNATRKLSRIGFEKIGNPDWYYDRAIYAWPIQMAIKLGIKLIVYGENVNVEYNGIQSQETSSAKEQINNGVILGGAEPNWKDWCVDGITMDDLQPAIYPTKEQVDKAGIIPLYVSYFVPWDGFRNYLVSQRHGYQHLGHEWTREGLPAEDVYHQTDTIGYNLSGYLKYQKFGFGVATDVVGWWRRHDPPRITIAQAKEIIRHEDHKLDQKMLNDFLLYTGYTQREFYKILDKWYNKKLFKQDRFGLWKIIDDGLDSVPDQPNEPRGAGFRSA